jgi:hypothetical protein
MSQDPPLLPTSPLPPPPPGPLLPPKVDMMASREMQAWIARLEAQHVTVGKRNRYLGVALALGILILLAALGAVYRSAVGSYAVVEGLSITRDPASQGRIGIRFDVRAPGKVVYHRTSGKIETEVVDYFNKTGPVQRWWSWVYEPGKNIDVALRYRSGLLPASERHQFTTSSRADIVILIDTTGSMDRSIGDLKDKCLAFCEKLKQQSLDHRIAVIGFGDVHDEPWLDKHDFTKDAVEFQTWVTNLPRFERSDVHQSALDALEEALSLPLDERAMHLFYLVSDASYHEPSRSGAKAADVAAKLEKAKVQLHVFSEAEYEADYRKVIVGGGKFQEMENFGKVLSEGRVLED